MIYDNTKSKDNKIEDYLDLYKYLTKNFSYGVIINGKFYKSLNKSIVDQYKTMSATQFDKNKCGICYDYVNYELDWFNKNHKDMKPEVFYIEAIDDNNSLKTHTWLCFEDDSSDNPYKAFEVSWSKNKGIIDYKSMDKMAKDYLDKFIDFYNLDRKTIKYGIYSLRSLNGMTGISSDQYIEKWEEKGQKVLTKFK